MKIMSIRLISTLVAGATVASLLAADQPALKTETQKVSYSLGVNIGINLRRLGVQPSEIDTKLLLRGLHDGINGSKELMTDKDVYTTLTTFQRNSWAKLSMKNSITGQAFLAANKSKPGVHTISVPIGPKGKTAELQYKVLKAGKGNPPTTTDTVTVNYTGKLIDGTVFDSSAKHGKPATFPVSRVIRGWTAALTKMKPGAEWELFIPPTLAYGTRGSGRYIGPDATLVFDVSLLSVTRPHPAPAHPKQPVTSDIIKVPSRAEMAKGAKIQVIKSSQAKKLQQEEKANTK